LNFDFGLQTAFGQKINFEKLLSFESRKNLGKKNLKSEILK